MSVLQAAPVQEMQTSAAKCCWCGAALIRARQDSVWSPWWCFTPACFERQRAWAVQAGTAGKRGLTNARWLFAPVPKQVEFFEMAYRLGQQAVADPAAGSARVLFGGAAGPGKSHALRWALYRDCLRYENLNCLLLRRTFGELEETHLREMAREQELIGAKYVSGDKEMRFPSTGSVIKAGHCEASTDHFRYLSTEYDRIMLDELVTFEMGAALEIMSRARTSKEAVKAAGGAQVWAGSNPGGRGALWVKAFFVDRDVDREAFPKYNPHRYGYVHAKLDDNPYIDPAYRQTLEEMTPVRRRQLLEGDWLAFDGQFFDFLVSKDGTPWHVADVGLTN